MAEGYAFKCDYCKVIELTEFTGDMLGRVNRATPIGWIRTFETVVMEPRDPDDSRSREYYREAIYCGVPCVIAGLTEELA